MVSCEVQSLDGLPCPLRAAARPVDAFPYAGRRTAVVQGAAGEWLELIEGTAALAGKASAAHA